MSVMHRLSTPTLAVGTGNGHCHRLSAPMLHDFYSGEGKCMMNTVTGGLEILHAIKRNH